MAGTARRTGRSCKETGYLDSTSVGEDNVMISSLFAFEASGILTLMVRLRLPSRLDVHDREHWGGHSIDHLIEEASSIGALEENARRRGAHRCAWQESRTQNLTNHLFILSPTADTTQAPPRQLLVMRNRNLES